ncbi:kinase-like domain-containing protein [Mycena vulgaris]|nr:kinase-like domain-containing protein [Mycena vulgaris]
MASQTLKATASLGPASDDECWVATQPADDPDPQTCTSDSEAGSWIEVVIPPMGSADPRTANDNQLVSESPPNFPLIISFPSCATININGVSNETLPKEPTTPPPDAQSSEQWSIKETDEICKFYDHGRIRFISQGSFGVVYSITKRGSDTQVAVKRMRFSDVCTIQYVCITGNSQRRSLQGPECGGQTEFRWQSDSEIAILQRLKGIAGVCQILEVFRQGNTIDIVLELISGGDLAQTLHRELGEETVKHIARQICATMKKVHENNVVHRDLKRENIVVEDSAFPTVKIVDFGSAKQALSAMNTQCGTSVYMAPERMGAGYYDLKVDVWSVGITLSLLLAKTCLKIIDDNERDISKERLVDQLIPCLHDAGISLEGQDFVRQLLRIDPSDRMSFEEALNHRWISAPASEPDETTEPNAEECERIEEIVERSGSLTPEPQEDASVKERERIGEVVERTGSLTLSADQDDNRGGSKDGDVATSGSHKKRRRSPERKESLSEVRVEAPPAKRTRIRPPNSDPFVQDFFTNNA